MNHRFTETVRFNHSVLITQEEFRQLLSKELEVPIPKDALITITVPSGGDYSGELLELDEVGGVTVKWTETIEK